MTVIRHLVDEMLPIFGAALVIGGAALLTWWIMPAPGGVERIFLFLVLAAAIGGAMVYLGRPQKR